MIRNENIICISSIDWDFIWQGHQEIMSTLAHEGNRVIFIENTGVRTPRIKDLPRIKKRLSNWFKGVMGIREEIENLYIFSPLVLPFPYSRIARWINHHLILSILHKWMKVMGFSDPVIWTFLPTDLSLDIAETLIKKLFIYYCIDDFAVSSVSAKKIKKSEIRLLKKADLVFVTSKALYNKCLEHNDNVHFFPFAVNFEEFEKAGIEELGIPGEFRNIKRPIIGYIGGIHKWIDQSLIKYLAEKHREYSFVLVGPLQTDISLLSDIKNIYFIGNKKHQELPYLIKNFSVAIIPYYITDYTKNVYPTKLNEYLAMGKPVIATNLPEIEMFNQRHSDVVYIGKNLDEFSENIVKALKYDSADLRRKRIEIARENSWQARIEQMSDLIESAVKKKMLDNEKMWKENLLVFYRIARKKLARATVGIGALYLLLFYTPFIWFLAGPLKISEEPQKSDAIVVFAGGVGESGKAAEGYEERVQYAVALYQKESANNLIFSSGYTYVFKEPLVMKALAISLGVPQNAIILEDRVRTTYEYVESAVRTLDKKGWNKILLVSSPYHMRRVSLVFNKIAKDIKVNYTPIPRSIFYAHEDRDKNGKRVWKRANLQQIKGILHEYLGILYYWWKGYI